MLLWCDDDDCDDIDCDDDGGDGDLSMILDEITVKSPKTIKLILHLTPIVMTQPDDSHRCWMR